MDCDAELCPMWADAGRLRLADYEAEWLEMRRS